MIIHFGIDKKKNFVVDEDIYCKLTDRAREYRLVNNHLCVKTKRGFIPLWRVVRNTKHPDLVVKYRDGDFTNLQRNNLQLCRRLGE